MRKGKGKGANTPSTHSVREAVREDSFDVAFSERKKLECFEVGSDGFGSCSSSRKMVVMTTWEIERRGRTMSEGSRPQRL